MPSVREYRFRASVLFTVGPILLEEPDLNRVPPVMIATDVRHRLRDMLALSDTALVALLRSPACQWHCFDVETGENVSDKMKGR